MPNRCKTCNVEFSGRKDAKFCSPKCRVTFNRLSVTDNPNVTVIDPEPVTDIWFEFKTKDIRSDTGFHVNANGKDIIRKAKYWYDVPLGAVPVLQKGWPKMPDYMNGREYFLWWKNEFDTKDDKPVIINPHPKYEKLDYVSAGPESRRWGA